MMMTSGILTPTAQMIILDLGQCGVTGVSICARLACQLTTEHWLLLPGWPAPPHSTISSLLLLCHQLVSTSSLMIPVSSSFRRSGTLAPLANTQRSLHASLATTVAIYGRVEEFDHVLSSFH